MAFSGHPISTNQRATNSSGKAVVRSILRRSAGMIAMCCGLFLVTGCATTMSFGSMPRIDQLKSLKIGSSTANDVLRALGEPRGRGEAIFGPGLPKQQVWSYEYTRSDGKKVQLKMLIVFIHKNIYEGEMWFSSGQLIGVTQ